MGSLFGGPPSPLSTGSRPALRPASQPHNDTEPAPHQTLPASRAPAPDRLSTILSDGNPLKPYTRPLVASAALANTLNDGSNATQLAQAADGQQPSDDDVRLLGRLIFAEAGIAHNVPGAMNGVGWVVRNRMGVGLSAKTLPQVIFRPHAFAVGSREWNKIDNPETLTAGERTVYEKALKAARGVLTGEVADPTAGATYFYSSETGEPPNWFKGKAGKTLPFTRDPIGIFYFLRDGGQEFR
jgi:spore germination cell wall hydrolase CwlJ-like protein